MSILWSKLSGNLGQLLNATVLTSLSFHLLFARREAASERAQFIARISILESLVKRFREEGNIPYQEVEKLMILSRRMRGGSEGNDPSRKDEGQGRIGVTWKEALLGRKAPLEKSQS